MKRSRELGMQTFDQALFDLYESNLVSYEGRAAQRRLGERPAPADQAQQPARAQRRPVGGHRAPDHRLTPAAGLAQNGATAHEPDASGSSASTQFQNLARRPHRLPRRVAFLGLGGWACRWPGTWRAPGMHHRLQPHRRQGGSLGRRIRRASAATPARPRGGATSCSPASATTTTCARWCWAPRRRLRRHEAGARSSSTTPPPRPKWRASWTVRRGGRRGLKFIDAPVSGGNRAPSTAR